MKNDVENRDKIMNLIKKKNYERISTYKNFNNFLL